MMKWMNARLMEIEAKPYYQYFLLLLIISIAIILRFYKLGEWSFWIDELRTISRAQVHYSTLDGILQNIPPNRNWIPVSTILIANAINYLGLSEWSARVVPSLIGIISVPALFFPIKRMLGPIIALITVLLLAVSPWHIYWSQNARFITSLMLFYSLALFAFFFFFEQDRLGYFLLFTAFLYIATSERLYTLLIVPVIICYLLLLKILKFEKPPGFRPRNLVALLLPSLIFIASELYSIIGNGTSRFFADFGGFFGSSIENPLGQGVLIFSEIGIPVAAFSFVTGIYLLFQKNRIGLLIWLGAVIPVGLVILVTPFMFTEERYAFMTLPSWLMLGAIGIKEIFTQLKGSSKILVLGVLVLFLSDTVGNNLLYYRTNNGNRRDWRGAFALVEEQSNVDDIYVATWPELGSYYLQKEVISWQDTNRDDIFARNKRVWFVVIPDMATFWGSQGFYRWVKNNAELVDVSYLRRRDNTNLYIYLYDPQIASLKNQIEASEPDE